MKTAKLGVIFIAAIFALTALGAAYAHWEETIKIEGFMTTDNIDVYFDTGCWRTNDPQYDPDYPNLYPLGVRQDPADCGYWKAGIWYGNLNPERRDKDVGWCDLALGVDADENPNDNHLIIEIGDAYPCYYAHPQFCIKNRGSCPVQVYGVQLLEVSEGNHKITLDEPLDLVVCKTYYVEIYKFEGAWTARVVPAAAGVNPDNFDYSIHLTGTDMAPGTQLDPTSWHSGETWHMDCNKYVGALYGDLCIHFENSCKQLTKYDFEIGITFYNWPEVVVG